MCVQTQVFWKELQGPYQTDWCFQTPRWVQTGGGLRVGDKSLVMREMIWVNLRFTRLNSR